VLASACLPAAAPASEPSLVDLGALNARIGLAYTQRVTIERLVDDLAAHRIWLYAEVHDQDAAPRQFVELVERVRERSGEPITIGVEFIDRADADLLEGYRAGTLSEGAFLDRIYPTSLLRSPDVGEAHLGVLRYARAHGIEVLPLESRPSGARPRPLRNSEIRVHLAEHLGRHPNSRLAVLYGVDHVLGSDPITAGLAQRCVVVTSYGDSALAAVRRREGRELDVGACVRLRPGVYLQSAGSHPGGRSLIRLELDDRENVLAAIESVYAGDRRDLGLVIDTLSDAEVRWRRAAFHALVYTSGQTLAYDPEALDASRAAGQARWARWWREASARTP
jgi:hypothetical protein